MSHALQHPTRTRFHKAQSKSVFRLRLILALGLMAFVILPTALPLRAIAQTGDPATSFSAKADKLLQRVYRAHAANSSAARNKSKPQTTRGQALEQPAAELEQLSQIVGIEPQSNGDLKVELTVRLAAGADESELRAAGFATGARIGNIVTVEADADRLQELSSLASVRKMAAAVYRHPLNDRARREVGIDNSSGQRVVGQTGRGVVVGIIDTGIDFRHGDFRNADGTTRIKALWDISDRRDDYSLPGTSVRRGHAYTQAEINAALAGDPNAVLEKDLVGHGTHVAGTAAGNGLGGTSPRTYAGMAPEADLVIVKAMRSTTATGGFSTNDEINSLAFIQQQAAALGEPFVINMSLGGHTGPHDGTGYDEQAIDNLVNGGPGRVVCIAAGNEGSDNVHARATIPAGGSLTLNFNVTSDSAAQFIDLYNRNLDKYIVTVTRPDGTALGPVSYVANPTGPGASDQYLEIDNFNDPQNNQPDIFLVFKPNAPSGSWTITLQDADSNSNGSFDAWTDGGNSTFSNYIDNNSHLVGSPGTSRGAITVGAYVTRSVSQTIGSYAPFTSPGPTADGRQKPEISAPGYYLYSSRSADVADTNFGTIGSGSNAPTDATHYTGLAGTSMATPVATGSVALMLQANPGLTSNQIKDYLTGNASHDGFDPSGWNSRFGFGKLNLAAALNATTRQSNPIDGIPFFIRQQYLDFFSREPDTTGYQNWLNTLQPCPNGGYGEFNNPSCDRVHISAAFYQSTEFQGRGYFVYRFYQIGLGRRPTYAEFVPDMVRIGGSQSPEQEAIAKAAYTTDFVQRAEFTTKYNQGQYADAAAYVRELERVAGVVVANEGQLISNLQAGTQTRGQVLRAVAESSEVFNKYYNQAFVAMQYFGYLKRDPDQTGFANWVQTLDTSGDYRHMIFGFLYSAEYRSRFGTP